MNGNLEEKKLGKKIASVSSLQGGIVFGKEEAWDKLQARLDKKPAITFPVFYRLAAAVLLLVVGFLFYNYQPTHSDIVRTHEMPTPHVISTMNIPAGQETTSVPSSVGTDTHLVAALTVNMAHISDQRKVMRLQPIATNLYSEVTELSLYPCKDTALLFSDLTKPKSKMKVVHINELDRPETNSGQDADTPDINAPSLVNINKRHVLHINDLMTQENERLLYRPESRPAFGITFLRQPSPFSYDETPAISQTKPFFKFKITNQN